MNTRTVKQQDLIQALPACARLAMELSADRLRADLQQVLESERLRADLQQVVESSWARQRTYSAHGTSDEYAADWRVLPLRSPGGDDTRTDAGGPGLEPFRQTRWAERTPYLAGIIDSLPATVRSARLMSLAPGSSVETHRDTPVGFPYGMVRLHVPLVTNDHAILVLDGETHCWRPGSLWYGDFSRPHSIRNDGRAVRVHLVIDCCLTPQLLDLFPSDFVRQVPLAEVVFERASVALNPVEAPSFLCSFAVPAGFAHWSGEALAGVDTDASDQPAEVLPYGDGLALRIEGAPAMALVHLGMGEFRLEGWTDERTLHVDHRQGVVRFFVRAGSRVDVAERTAALNRQ